MLTFLATHATHATLHSFLPRFARGGFTARGRNGAGRLRGGIASCSWLLGTILNLGDDRWLSLTPDGHYRGNAGIEKDIVYVATTDAGEQITLTPEEFEKRFGWKNDASEVKLSIVREMAVASSK